MGKMREKAYKTFTSHLLRRDIRPGQFISQRELVELTGLTLGSIREVVPRLEADGLIVTIPQRGMQVAHVDLALIRNAFQLRLILEREAAALYTQNASDDELAQLRESHQAILSAAAGRIDAPLIDRAQEVDWNLHDTIIDALGNDIISKAYRVNSVKIRLIRQEQTRLYEGIVVPVMKEHLKILEAFETRDPEKGAAAVAEHVNNARNRAMGL